MDEKAAEATASPEPADASPETAPSWAGRSLSHYKLIRCIGRGGIGDVYLAQDTTLGRPVAVKVLRDEYTRDRERLARFEQEAYATSALNHPSILTIHDVAEEAGTHFIVTEHVDGPTLREVVDSRALTADETLEIGLQVASALESAHRSGIVHRDIKPENVMWRPDRLVKVLDFGLAKLTDTTPVAADTKVQTDPGLLLGTLRYMSPEQARGQGLDGRTDIFSLGIVLYEMLTRRPPFESDTVAGLMVSLLDREPVALGTIRPDVPPALEQIIGKMLRKERMHRYSSAQALLKDLRGVRQAQDSGSGPRPPGPEAPPLPPAEVQTPRAARGRLTLGSTVLAALTLLVGLFIGLSVRSWRDPRLPRVIGFSRITQDGYPKLGLASDGTRLYFSAYVSSQRRLYQVASAGGESVPVATFTDAWVLDISPDGRELLVLASASPQRPGPLWTTPVVGGSPRQISSSNLHYAVWSPDGHEIVYSKGSDLFQMAPDGTGSHLLAHLPGIGYWMSWSPDGARLRLTVSSPLPEQHSIWEIPRKGGQARPVFGETQASGASCGAWSPDGRYFYFSSGGNIWVWPEKQRLLERRLRAPVRLTVAPLDLEHCVPSPDGRRLFTIGGQSRGELSRYDAEHGRFVPFMGGISADSVDFSADGRWVTYRLYPDGTLWHSRVDGSERVQLTQPPMQAYLARSSPDGTRIVFTGRAPDKAWKVHMVSAQGGLPEQLLPDDREERTPNFSPDGKSIVFGTRTFVKDDLWSISTLDLETRALSPLPKSEGLFSPAWSPDGRYILALRPGLGEAMLFDRTTSRWETLPPQHRMSYPRWSRDGSYIYFLKIRRTDPGIYRMRVGDWTVEQLASTEGMRLVQTPFASWMGLAPDDAPLLLRDAGTQDIYAVDLDVP